MVPSVIVLDATWTCLATLAMSREMSCPLDALPIKITTCRNRETDQCHKLNYDFEEIGKLELNRF